MMPILIREGKDKPANAGPCSDAGTHSTAIDDTPESRSYHPGNVKLGVTLRASKSPKILGLESKD
jgi:hypothetical protein